MKNFQIKELKKAPGVGSNDAIKGFSCLDPTQKIGGFLLDDMRLLSHARSRDLQSDELLNTIQIRPLVRIH